MSKPKTSLTAALGLDDTKIDQLTSKISEELNEKSEREDGLYKSDYIQKVLEHTHDPKEVALLCFSLGQHWERECNPLAGMLRGIGVVVERKSKKQSEEEI